MKLAVISDFDDTATKQNVAGLLLERFGGLGAKMIRKQHQAGEITFREYQERAFWSTTAPISEMYKFAAENAALRPGFSEAAAIALATGTQFQIVSAGLEFYISAVLSKHRLGYLPYRAVKAGPETAVGSQIRYDYTTGRFDCEGDWATCKCSVVRETQKRGVQVAFAGDGLTSDACASSKADIVFARGRLLEHCRHAGTEAIPFEDFDQIAHLIERSAR